MTIINKLILDTKEWDTKQETVYLIKHGVKNVIIQREHDDSEWNNVDDIDWDNL